MTPPASHTSAGTEVTISLATKPTPPLLRFRPRPEGRCDSSGAGPASVSQPVCPCETLVGGQETGSNKAMGPQGPSLCTRSRTPGGTFALSSRGGAHAGGPRGHSSGVTPAVGRKPAGTRGRAPNLTSRSWTFLSAGQGTPEGGACRQTSRSPDRGPPRGRCEGNMGTVSRA